MRSIIIALTSVLFLSAALVPRAGAEGPADAEALLKQKEEAFQTLQKENALLQERINSLESTPTITSDALALKNYQRLQEIARDTKAQRQTMAEFEGFVKWMTTNLSGYAKYVEAGSVAAGFAKILPIPYAGQASLFTKFVSQGVLSLNASSVAINRYLGTSQQFIGRVESLDPARPNTRETSDLTRFADEQLLKEMNEVQAKLAATGELSTSTLSFLESLNHYISSTDEYWNRTKSLLKKSDADKKEKSFLSESIQSLKNRAGNFNGKLKLFNETARKDAPLIKTLSAYDELIREMEAKVAAVKK
ncbi:MAG: hypothetical protein FD174_550 [Geobacteraceae bacterium]|nr:MAG: hypothetical protein FD174_550 [Geobacteraceae bacterium]